MEAAYTTAVVTLLGIGLACAGYFCISWTPRAIRSGAVLSWHALDVVGWVWAGLIILLLSVWSLATHHEVLQPPSVAEALRRLFTLTFIDALVMVRAVRWWQIVRLTKQEHKRVRTST